MTPATVGSRINCALILLALFVVALVPRLYNAQTVGISWDSPGSFTLINFDEGGSCRAALGGFSYSTFIGRQTIALATWLGKGPPPGIEGDAVAVKAYCHSAQHIGIARTYSALLGALTVVVTALLALQLMPSQPRVAWVAAGLLALSGFHITQSQVGTVDAPSVFYIYSFIALLTWSLRRGACAGLIGSFLLVVASVWTKYWVFAVLAYFALLPMALWRYVSVGFSPLRIMLVMLASVSLFAVLTNTATTAIDVCLIIALYCVLIPWRKIKRPMIALWLLIPIAMWQVTQIDLISTYTAGTASTRFGAGYAAIGENKWLRNLINIPIVLLVSLGAPACFFIPAGVRAVLRGSERTRLWLCLLLPSGAFLLFMALLAPVTYYRHYLPLLPCAAILASAGVFATRWGGFRWFLVFLLLWPALLAVDLVSDYYNDPRIELRRWYQQHPDARVFASYYVSPPPSETARTMLFSPDYAQGGGLVLKRATHLILSENWYDTAFANELNGPRVAELDHLIKTIPEYARFYRQVLADEHPNLELVDAFDLSHFMPELILHRLWYGNFSLFVGDLKIYRVKP